MIAWIFFRATTFDGAILMVEGLVNIGDMTQGVFTTLQEQKSWFWVAVAGCIALFCSNTKSIAEKSEVRNYLWAKMAFVISILMMWVLFVNNQNQEFIYFNF